MKVMTIIFFTMVLTLLHSMLTDSGPTGFPEREHVATKGSGRFLKGITNPRATSHLCDRDRSVCNYFMEGGRNTTCCNNKCVETTYDGDNCGACGQKCALGEACCGGECVNLGYDKRHCGFCDNKCKIDGSCVYGICDYA
ncbi:hypothetical protein Sango_0831700 [Sesamum angolense]|uniref:Stigma-specific Stig1 family protein n=1 Tax=Sesamum angolense TaxID=2727404 RepID=A0AAE2C0M2_9LAMI|nr:hypothetical protein Sango_0831700 [Sesamum angolense]